VPTLKAIAQLKTIQAFTKPGIHLVFQDLARLATLVNTELQGNTDGVVITQGTDTIEETAFALQLMTTSQKPVVVTGAMRHPTSLSADGPANLEAAVRVAVSASAHNLGCVVVMNNEIHAARFVRKMHTGSLNAFQSPNIGPIGWIREGTVKVMATPKPTPTISVNHLDRKVLIVTTGLGEDGAIIAAAENAGYDGIVLAAAGAGHVSEQAATHIKGIANRLPVVLSSRAGSGDVFENTYGFVGSEIDLLKEGIIHAGSLDPTKARVLLTLLLCNSADQQDIRRAFAQF
jgi:L-asparaginase